MITNGRDALEEVAKKDGRWNWVLVGPNSDSLPLVGGGGGSVDEMRHCLAKQEADQKAEKQFANFYGLLRMKFGTGRAGRTKYIFVQASRADEREAEEGAAGGRGALKRGNTMSAVKQAQATQQRGAMERALLEFAHFTAKLDAKSLDDLSLDAVIEKVQKGSTADADLLTAETYYSAHEEFLAKNPDLVVKVPESAEPENLTAVCAQDIVEHELAPNGENSQAEQEDDDGLMTKFYSVKTTGGRASMDAAASAALPAEPEPPMKTDYKRGQLVFVYSSNAKQWLDDGIVVTVLTEPGVHDGLALPEGAVKVQYNNRRQFKWCTPFQAKDYIKPSVRPVPPPTLLGELLKETHNFISQWHVRYFELSKGYLQWWMSAEDAKAGVDPNGSLSLGGLEMAVKGTIMYLRTSNTKGMVYAFDATSSDSIRKWSDMMVHHEEYCRKMQVYLTERASEAEQATSSPRGGKEKFTEMVGERKRRVSFSQQQG